MKSCHTSCGARCMMDVIRPGGLSLRPPPPPCTDPQPDTKREIFSRESGGGDSALSTRDLYGWSASNFFAPRYMHQPCMWLNVDPHYCMNFFYKGGGQKAITSYLLLRGLNPVCMPYDLLPPAPFGLRTGWQSSRTLAPSLPRSPAK